jgi:hypothetical protein
MLNHVIIFGVVAIVSKSYRIEASTVKQDKSLRSTEESQIPGSCPEGYIRVPSNADVFALPELRNKDHLGDDEDFCVMKYEAKIIGIENGNVDGYHPDYRAESRASGTPWVNISRDEAIEACKNIGAELISNAQWQVIARNIEEVKDNWHDGGLNQGHCEMRPSRALDATHEGTGFRKRTHVLSNKEVIWDLSGNAWSWVIDNNDQFQGEIKYISEEPWTDPSSKLRWGPKGDYKHLDWRTRFGGLGYAWIGGRAGAVVRGGGWLIGQYAGVFYTNLNYGPKESDVTIGFRCVTAVF